MTIECKNCSMHEQCICEVSADECEIRKQSYNKAIDDFANACKEDILCQTFGLHQNGIERIAKQLKEGGENV